MKATHASASRIGSRSVPRSALPTMAALALAACSFLEPLPERTSLDQRLAAFPQDDLPLKGRTIVHWDRHQVPFVEAEHDTDAAFALGLAQAHLRLGQLEMGKRIAHGRLAELIGKPVVDVDIAVRTLDFTRAVPEMVATMPEPTRQMLQAFVDGINTYIERIDELPQEFRVLKFEPEPWTVADVLALGRLAGNDANWKIGLALLPLRDEPNWPEIWAQLLQAGTSETVVFDGDAIDEVDPILEGFGRSGSNAIAIGPSRSLSGSPLFAADPHVGYIAPTIWLMGGIKSPSYHATGMMPLGAPFFALGRSPTTAWGGTNLYSLNSVFLDVSGVPASQITTRTEVIGVGKRNAIKVHIRETPWGPIISDLLREKGYDGPDVALRWVGHQPSREMTAMLGANSATSFGAFREALGDYAVRGMNMLYADTSGNVGHVLSTMVPARPGDTPPDILIEPELSDRAWSRMLDATELPAELNPHRGYTATANNRPRFGDQVIGYFFSTDDRINRIDQLIERWGKLDLERLKELQRDVYMESAHGLARSFAASIREMGVLAGVGDEERAFFALMESWDGRYEADSRAALAYELFREAYIAGFAGISQTDTTFTSLAKVIGDEVWLTRSLGDADRAKVARTLSQALRAATGRLEPDATWGSAHALELRHPFAAIPIVGKRYRFGGFPMAGGVQTLAKAAHYSAEQGFKPSAGVTARFISDLSATDENFGILTTGQDGWLNSPNFLDQTPMLLAGEYVRLPLDPETVRANAYRSMELSP